MLFKLIKWLCVSFISLFLLLIIFIIYIIITYKYIFIVDSQEERMIKGLAVKVEQVMKEKNISINTDKKIGYFHDINLNFNLIKEEQKYIDKGLTYRYSNNKLYFTFIWHGFDSYYYYNATNDCWYDYIRDTVWFARQCEDYER